MLISQHNVIYNFTHLPVQNLNSQEINIMKYHILLRLVHWLMAMCIIGLIIAGWYMTGLAPEDESRPDFYHFHKSFGVLLLFLFIVRILLRIFTKIPALPETIRPVEKKLSHIAHIFLYTLMLTVPVIGYIFSNSGGYDVPLFSIKMPGITDKNKELFDLARQAHWISAYILSGILLLHITAVIKHRFFEPAENNVIRRMT